MTTEEYLVKRILDLENENYDKKVEIIKLNSELKDKERLVSVLISEKTKLQERITELEE